MKIGDIKIAVQVHVVVLKVGYPKNPKLYIKNVSRESILLTHMLKFPSDAILVTKVGVIKNTSALLLSQLLIRGLRKVEFVFRYVICKIYRVDRNELCRGLEIFYYNLHWFKTFYIRILSSTLKYSV